MAGIAVVGTGYVGLTTGVCFAHTGHNVTCVDIDEMKVARLRAGDVPIYEPGLDELLESALTAGRIRFTTSFESGLEHAQFVFIAVGTPSSGDGHVDMSHVYAAARQIGYSLKGPAIIVNKSTTPIGTAGSIARLMGEVRPELSPWIVVSNPEFLREGCAVHDCLHPARIVLGATDIAHAQAVAQLYREYDCPIIMSDPNSAEMIKYASNAFLATRISFINEVARICGALDADVSTVAKGMGLDPRIGPEFLNAGLGYGGSCFPKDVAALKQMAADSGLHPQLLTAVTQINEDQRRWVVDQLESRLDGLRGRTIALWGLAFKPETDDLRQAPALDIARRLIERGAHVQAYDPVVRMESGLVVAESPEESATNADAVLIATDWPEFKEVGWERIAAVMRGVLVFDGRNHLDPDSVAAAGLTYAGVGRRRPAVETQTISA